MKSTHYIVKFQFKGNPLCKDGTHDFKTEYAFKDALKFLKTKREMHKADPTIKFWMVKVEHKETPVQRYVKGKGLQLL